MTTFKDFLMEANEGSVDIRKDPYASKIEQILRKEIEKKYHFLGKLLEADFNLRYNSTKAEPKLYLFYDIKGNKKDIDDSLEKEFKEWIMGLIDSGILEPVNETLPGNKIIVSPRVKFWNSTWRADRASDEIDCYCVSILFKIKAIPREVKPKEIKIARNKYSGDLRKIEVIIKDVLKKHSKDSSAIKVDCVKEEDNIYPTVYFRKITHETAHEGKRILMSAIPDLRRELKNYPDIDVLDDPYLYDDEYEGFVTMALPYNGDDE